MAKRSVPGKRRSITMAHIAEEAGVAQTTVSFVLNGQARKRGVSQVTAQRIREVVERLNYVPNAAARSLSMRRTGFIGVVFAGLVHEWPQRVMTGAREVFEAEGDYVPLISIDARNVELERREIQVMLERQVEAIICRPIENSDNYRRIVDGGVPLVFIGRALDSMPNVSYVAWDSRLAVKAAVRHLIAAGRRRIAYVGWDTSDLLFRDRYEGYCQAISEAGLAVRDNWVGSVGYDQPVHSVVRRILDSDSTLPDAILASLWIQALEVLEVLDERGVRVPRDIALMTLGDSMTCRQKRISVSTVIEPAEEVGREAARAALHLIKHPRSGPIQKLISDYQIADRGTTNGAK